MSGRPSLAIGIASSASHRRRLAELFGGSEAVLIVSSVDQARRFLGVAGEPAAPPAESAAHRVVVTAAPAATALSIDSDRRVLRWRNREIGLTPLEHDLLRCLVGTPGHTWTHRRLHREVWGTERLGRGSDLHSVVRRVRRKLARLGVPATIDAVRGVGFRLALP
ncbi:MULTISPECIES: winged helix-turn-helix domain-containing protein [unclassified Micromonospora]|uniref:winged helix-turn-helix domain-containing protein n=1 Tax=unclassified Micromonospora TaxID=2617518 RepID=UPI00098D4E03|nr:MULTISPECIES: winged helix-turn-helix domain-containing protein [unclassified Micromonospora]OON30677.1 transcriptional regulator [Micromonospora sp. Rc5]